MKTAKTIITRAHLVRGTRWYIDYTRTDLSTGSELRRRQDFDLNEIDDLRVREEVAARLVRYLEIFSEGKSKPVASDTDATGLSVREALAAALQRKEALPRESSRRGYRTVARAFLAWCNARGYATLQAPEFTKRHARAFLDHLVKQRDYRNRTLNNYTERLQALWKEMQDDEVVQENPWLKIPMRRNEEKLRRMFTDQERRIVAAEVERCDYWLFRGLLLQFFCYIRPVEIWRLRFRDFDLGRGTVTVREEAAKGWRKVVKTIPESVLPYFTDGIFNRQPGNFYMFGRVGEGARAKMLPSPVQIDELRPYKRHARILQRLHDSGALPGDISGLTWYSWKDTGISLHAAKTSPLATRDQAGHVDFAITDVYYHAPEIIPEYRKLENDLFL